MPVLDRFYTAFAQRDWATMGACYADDARFSDPVFPALDAAGVRTMWKMLMTGARDFKLTYSITQESATTGRVTWEARYTFSATGRPVRNRVRSTFTFKDGLILEQKDDFNFWRWSRQALGMPGLLMGWTPLVKSKVRRTAARSLERSRTAGS